MEAATGSPPRLSRADRIAIAIWGPPEDLADDDPGGSEARAAAARLLRRAPRGDRQTRARPP